MDRPPNDPLNESLALQPPSIPLIPSISGQSRFEDANSQQDISLIIPASSVTPYSHAATFKVEIVDDPPTGLQPDMNSDSVTRMSEDHSMNSFHTGPRVRKSSFTFEDYDKEEKARHLATIMDVPYHLSHPYNHSTPLAVHDKRNNKGSDSRDLAIEATRRLASVSRDGDLPAPMDLKRRLSRPSTGSSTISRLSSNLVQEVIRPLGRRVKGKHSEPSSAKTETGTDTSGSGLTDTSDPADLPRSLRSESSSRNPGSPVMLMGGRKMLLPGLEIVTTGRKTIVSSPVEYIAYPPASPSTEESRFGLLQLRDKDRLSPASTENYGPIPFNKEPLVVRLDGAGDSDTEETTPLTQRPMTGGSSGEVRPVRIARRDSATKEARMESAVHSMMMGGTGARLGREDSSRLRQRSEETIQPVLRRLRTTSEMGATRSRSETAGSRRTDSMISFQDERGNITGPRLNRMSRALSDITGTPPVTPIKTRPERPFDLVDSAPRPSPMYTFPQKDLLIGPEPTKVIKPRRSGFMSYLREKMLSRSGGEEPIGEDGLSDSQRIRETYLETSSRGRTGVESRSNTLPNPKARPKRAVSQMVTPSRARTMDMSQSPTRTRPTSMLVPSPSRMDASDQSKPIVAGPSSTTVKWDVEQDRTEQASLIALKSRDMFFAHVKMDDTEARRKDEARIRKLENEVRTTPARTE
jgi:hypothetical protein